MPICYYHYTRQSEDWHPPRPGQRLCRTTNFFIYENNTHNCGWSNEIHANSASIGGGYANQIYDNSDFSTVAGGCQNNVGRSSGVGSIFSVISGGCHNTIDSAPPGLGVPQTTYGVIGGGQCNCICFGTNHSSISSGHSNCVADSCSSILGGAGNIIPAGIPFTGMFANGLTATVSPATMLVPSAFWVDELVVANIPMGGAGPSAPPTLPVGGLWYYPDALGNKVVYVK